MKLTVKERSVLPAPRMTLELRHGAVVTSGMRHSWGYPEISLAWLLSTDFIMTEQGIPFARDIASHLFEHYVSSPNDLRILYYTV